MSQVMVGLRCVTRFSHPRTLLLWFLPYIPLLIHSFIFLSSSFNKEGAFQAPGASHWLATCSKGHKQACDKALPSVILPSL